MFQNLSKYFHSKTAFPNRNAVFLYIFVTHKKIAALKNILYTTLLLFCFTCFAQNDKTLFWEISGNGLTKKSYLYGTMHVNDKVSYHLSDAFFKNLLAADMVGNESDPETWIDIADLVKQNEITSSYKFYSEFYKNPAKKEDIKTVFETNNSYFNNMLSAIGGDTSDFQENTVLDMFIYQTGRKYKKQIVGLEEAKGSIIPLLKLKEEDVKPKEENKLLLIKILKNRNFNEVLKQYYREKDVVMLDSIYKLMLSKKAHDALISIRNETMANSIDSLSKKGSLFSAVGAAHLAGKGGIIELLRKKGYTVSPIFDTFSENGQTQKKNIEEFFPNPGFKMSNTRDMMVQMPLTKNIIEENKNLGSPDFTNGGVINIKRVPLNYFIKKESENYNPKSLDSLFFEKIPGNIIDKKYFETDNIVGYDIKNVTKTGNNQRYKFYITPLEIIGISMTGVGNYVRQFENEVFDNIKIKAFDSNWEKITPKKGGFTIEAPAFYTNHGDSSEELSNVEIQAYDNSEKGYYFLTEKTLNDLELLEDSEYEQKQIHYEFYLQHDSEVTNSNFDKTKKSYESTSKIGDKNIRLKSFINGNKYYLLGTVNASDKNSSRFFNSFSLNAPNYTSKSSVYNDTIAKFKIEIPEKLNDKLFLNIEKDEVETKNMFENKTKYYNFISETGRTINLLYYKYSKYESIKDIDSMKVSFKKYFLKQEDENDETDYSDDYDYTNINSVLSFAANEKKGISKSLWSNFIKEEKDTYEMISESVEHGKGKNDYTFNALVSKPQSNQAIKYKAVFKDDAYYMLKTLVDRNYKNDDAFVEKTFKSLEPLERIIKDNQSVFDDKISLFIEDAKSESDTIRYSAMNSLYEINLEKKDIDVVKNFLETFEFKDSETDAINSLLLKLGELKDERIIPFLENYYKKEGTKTEVQLSVIKALANQESKNGYKKIMELLEFDLPITDIDYDITGLFYFFERDLENSKELFPKIFQFYSIPEYNKPVIDFCNSLLDKDLISVKKINSFKKMILTNAKLEYKRVASWKEKNNTDEEDDEAEEDVDYEDYNVAPTENLANYIGLLYNFPKDNTITELFEKSKRLDIPELNLELLRLGIVNNKISNEEIQEALKDSKNQFFAINLLLNKNKGEMIKLSDDEIAKSALMNFNDFDEKDSINLIEKRIVEQSKKQTVIYFYQVEEDVKEEEVAEKKIFPIAFVLENNKINPLAYKNYTNEILQEEDDVTKKIDAIIQKALNEKHFRASFEKEKPFENPLFLDQY